MKPTQSLMAGIGMILILSGCETLPPGVERGPHGTIAYDVLVEASPPGARVEVNGEVVGETPLNLRIFGDRDGTFHDFGSPYYIVRGLPITTNQFVQTRVFGTGRFFGPEDRIPDRIYFDMNQNVQYLPGPPVYVYPDYGPRMHWGPGFYHHYSPRYYGPGVRFHFRAPIPPHHRPWRR